MILKIVCPQCGQEKEVDVKVPKFCGNTCRLIDLRARRTKKIISPEVMTEEQAPVVEQPVEDVNIQPEVTGDTAMVSPQEATGDTPVQQ